MTSELEIFLTWYLAFAFFGVIGYPLTAYFFDKWPDKGYGFAKMIGLLAIALPVWFLASIGGAISTVIDKLNGEGAAPVINIIKYNQTTVWLAFLIGFALAAWLIYTQKVKLNQHIIVLEIIFAINFALWVYIRSSGPRVEGTEKFMNLAFMNSINRSESFPPIDPWYTGGTINYYYLGHYLYAFVGKLTGIGMSYAYNYGLVTVIAMSFISCMSIGLQLFKKRAEIIASWLGKAVTNATFIWLDLVSDLVGSTKKVKTRQAIREMMSFNFIRYALAMLIAGLVCYASTLYLPISWLGEQIHDDLSKYQIEGVQKFYFPDPTRSIAKICNGEGAQEVCNAYTITEQPAYSIVLGDLHGHFLELPIFIFVVALAIRLISQRVKVKKMAVFYTLASLLIMPLYGINTWGFITANALLLLANIIQIIRFSKVHWLENLQKSIVSLILVQMILVLPGVLFMAPYLMNYKAAVTGEGNFISKTIGFTPVYLSRHYKGYTQSVKDPVTGEISESRVEPNAAIKQMVDEKLKGKELGTQFMFWGYFIIIGSAILYYIASRKKSEVDTDEKSVYITAIALGIFVFAIFIGTELFFIRDLFSAANPPYFRANTMFKFFYHGWVIASVASVAGLYLAIVHIKDKFVPLLIGHLLVIGLLGIGVFGYMQIAVESFYSNAFNLKAPPYDVPARTMEGHSFMQSQPDGVGDYQVVEWVNKNIKGQPVLVEAVGESYTYYARISVNTGVGSIVGWPGHEWQWRGNDQDAYGRKSEVNAIYTTPDVALTQNLIAKYNVEYIYYGSLEKKLSGGAEVQQRVQDVLSQVGKVVYQDEAGNALYQIIK